MKEANSDDILIKFESYCLQNDAAAKALNSKSANKYAKRIINCYLQLKEVGKANELSKLFNSENENVRLWAATHSLPTNEFEAKRILQDLALKPGLNAFSAEKTLLEWEKGNLKLIYDSVKVKW